MAWILEIWPGLPKNAKLLVISNSVGISNLLKKDLGHQDINVLALELLLVDHHVQAENEGEDPLVLLVQRPIHLKMQGND